MYPARVVVAHLGTGASMCAIIDGESTESTLQLVGLDDLPMRTHLTVPQLHGRDPERSARDPECPEGEFLRHTSAVLAVR
ncbi:MAG: hypothetical protein RKK15_09780 [Defluviicoccus sp.]|nr:hypothetical protein [Defluviicoccus sp.]